MSVVKSAMVGTTYYAAVKIEDFGKKTTEVIGIVALTTYRDHEFCYKGMTESCGPFSFDCPKSILSLLSPTDDKESLAWRKECLKRAEAMKLSDVKVGQEITFDRGDEHITLRKCAPNYQFRRSWWHREVNNTYYPSKHIPSDWKLVG